MMKFPRPSPSIFAYCKRSKTGGLEGLGMRLPMGILSCRRQSKDKQPTYVDDKVLNDIKYRVQ